MIAQATEDRKICGQFCARMFIRQGPDGFDRCRETAFITLHQRNEREQIRMFSRQPLIRFHLPQANQAIPLADVQIPGANLGGGRVSRWQRVSQQNQHITFD